MTSRNLLCNVARQDLKSRLWTIVLASIVFFFAYPVLTVLLTQMEKVSPFATCAQIADNVHSTICSVYGISGGVLPAITIVGAVITSLNGFSYLFSKQKVDLFHSLPIKRWKLFLVKYVDGILIYLVPLMVATLLCWLFVGIFGFMCVEIAVSMLYAIFVNLLGYLLIYTTVILGCMLTGSGILAIFVSLILLFYAPVMYNVYLLCRNLFFESVIKSSLDVFCTKAFSPAIYYADMIMKANESFNLISPASSIIGAFVMIIVLIALCIVTYLLRKSEAANNSVAFDIVKQVIRYMCTIPGSILFGILFMVIAGDVINDAHKYPWMFFGTVCGAILFHGFIQSIFEHDIRKWFSRPIDLITEGGIVAVLAVIFVFDIFNVNGYMPNINKVDHVAIVNSELLNSSLDHYENGVCIYNEYDKELNEMALADKELAYEIMKKVIAESKSYKNDVSNRYDDIDINVSVMYTLKNGKTVARKYHVNEGDVHEYMKALYNDEGYRKTHFSEADKATLEMSHNEFEVTLFTNGYYNGRSEIKPSKEALERFVKAYTKEIKQLTYDEVLHAECVGQLSVSVLKYYENANYSGYLHDGGCYWYQVYEGMDETEKVLKELFEMQ